MLAENPKRLYGVVVDVANIAEVNKRGSVCQSLMVPTDNFSFGDAMPAPTATVPP